MNEKRAMRKALVYAVLSLAVLVLAIPEVSAYCLTGVRWPDSARPAPVYHNASGKVISGQCISSSQMDSAVQGGVTAWKALRYGGTTSKTANKKDGQNTVGWAKLGGQTLAITNYLNNDRYRTVLCKGNYFANLYEADVRISTSWRWTSNQGQCPCAAGAAIYLDTVVMHEHGHVSGLCHVSNPSSLMSPSVAACEYKNKGSDETSGENALCY